ncbi:MAG: hypothetical protein V4689_06530 [Verrucomicrobiota bacterium]
MSKSHISLLALCFLGMAVAGWNLGGNSGEPPAVPPPAATRSSRTERPVRVRPGPAGEAAQRLAAIRASTDPAERLRATIDLASTLPSAQFATWLDGGWFNLDGGMESTVFTGILMERWRQEDPEGHLLWCRKNKSTDADSVLSGWAETEPQRALDFFKSHPGDSMELAVLGKIAVKHPELALRRFQEMAAAGISNSDDAGDVLAELAKQAPAALGAILDTLPSALKSEAEKSLIARRMEDSFATELRKLWDRPDGFDTLRSIFLRSGELGGKLIDELANLPPSWRDEIASTPFTFIGRVDAAKWAAADLEGAGFTAEQAGKIRTLAVSRLKYDDPDAAFQVWAELDLLPDEKTRILASIFESLQGKPEKAEALLALLGSEEEREIARKALQSDPFGPEAEIKPIPHPAEWLATAAALDPQSQDSWEYLQMVQGWEPEKAAALVAGFHSLPDARKKTLAQFIGAAGVNGDFPLKGEALAYLVAHPADAPVSGDPDGPSRIIEFTSDYVAELGKQNPEKAGDWIRSLPDSEAKLYAAKNLQSVWSLYDPEAAERWMKTLPATTRAKVKELGKAGE